MDSGASKELRSTGAFNFLQSELASRNQFSAAWGKARILAALAWDTNPDSPRCRTRLVSATGREKRPKGCATFALVPYIPRSHETRLVRRGWRQLERWRRWATIGAAGTTDRPSVLRAQNKHQVTCRRPYKGPADGPRKHSPGTSLCHPCFGVASMHPREEEPSTGIEA